MVRVNLEPNVEGLSSVVVEVPANITRFKIVPPPVIGLSITGIRLSMEGRIYNIATSAVTTRGMVNHDGGMRVTTSEAFVWFPLPAAARSAGAKTVGAELQFNVASTDLFTRQMLLDSGSTNQ